MATIRDDYGTNLVSHWKLEETGGTRADVHGVNHLTDNDTVLSTTGVQGTCATFLASATEWLSASPSGIPTGSNAFSISYWIKSDTDAVVPIEWGTIGSLTRIQLYQPANQLGVLLNGGNIYWTATNINDDTWRHIVITHAGGQINSTNTKAYMNGSALTYASANAQTPNISASPSISIGSAQLDGGGYYVNGEMDEVSIWSAALSSSDVTAIYNSGSGIPYAATDGTSGIYPAGFSYHQQTSATPTWSHTCDGTNRILFVGFATGAASVTSVTYNGTAMTLVDSNTAGVDTYLYMLVNPDTGTNNVVVTLGASSWCYAAAGSYEGVEQANQPDGNDNSRGTGATLTSTVTTTDDNCWGVLINRSESSGNSTANSGCTKKIDFAGYVQFYDSNADITPAGSTSFVTNTTGAGYAVHAMGTFSPAAAATFTPKVIFF